MEAVGAKINTTIKTDLANKTKIFHFSLQFPNRTLSDKTTNMKALKYTPIWCSEVSTAVSPSTRVGAADYPRQEAVLSTTTPVLSTSPTCSWTSVLLVHFFLLILLFLYFSCLLNIIAVTHPLSCFPLRPPPESRLSVFHTSLVFNTSSNGWGRAERPRATHRYLLPHAGLGEVWFHPAANLPYNRLCWLTLVRPLTCVQLVPNGAENRDWAWISKNH